MALLPLLALKGMFGGGKQPQVETQRSGKEVATKISGRKKEKAQVAKGGAIVPLFQSSQESKVQASKSGSEETITGIALQIQHKTLKVKDILKGSLVLEKMQEKNKEKEEKKAERRGEETELEEEARKKASKGKFGLTLPGSKKIKGIWERIADFFVLTFWFNIGKTLIQHSDLLGEWLPKIGKWVDGVLDGIVGFIDGVTTAIDEGMGFEDWIKEVGSKTFGGTTPEGQQAWKDKFDEVIQPLKRVIGLVAAVGAGVAAMAVTSMVRGFRGGKLKGPRGPGSHSGPRKPGSAPRTTGSTGISRGWSKFNRFFRKNVTRGSNAFTRNISKIKPFNFKVSKGSNTLTRNISKLKPINTRVTVGSGGVKSLLNPKNLASGLRTAGIGIVLDWAATSLFENFVFKPMETASRNRRNEKLDKRIEEKGLEYVINKNKELIAEASAVQPLNWWQNALTLGFGNAAGGYNTAQMRLKIFMEDLNYIQEKYGVSVLGKEGPTTNLTSNPTTVGGRTTVLAEQRGSKLAGELGHFMKGIKNTLPVTGSIHRHPEHPPWDPESGHRKGSLHYRSQGARAIDIGGWSPSTPKTRKFPGSTGADEQAPVLKALLKWNKEKGVNPVELIHGSPAHKGVGEYREYPDAHHHHVHVAYHKGGEVPGTGERLAKLLGGEMVIDVDSAQHKPVKNMLLAINEASTYEGVVNAIRKFAPYDARSPETIMIPNIPENLQAISNKGTEVVALPMFQNINELDPFEFLYKGS